jgi:hypothetical protein
MTRRLSVWCTGVACALLSAGAVACSSDGERFAHPWIAADAGRALEAMRGGEEPGRQPPSATSDASVPVQEAPTETTAEAPPVRSVAPFQPTEPTLPKLTAAQYTNVIRDLLGAGLSIPELEPDQRPYGFSIIGASQSTLSERGTELYLRAAFALAQEAFRDLERRKRIVPCEPETPLDDACLSSYLESFGRRAFRRPLSADEVARYRALAKELGGADSWQTLEYLTATLLQSPHFLYRVELGEPDSEKPGWLRYTGYEMAARLSFLLRNSTPDDELLAAAERGDLDSSEGVVAAAARLLDDRQATEEMLSELYAEYLELSLLDKVNFPTEMNPNGTIARAMRDEVLEIVKRVALRDSEDMRTIFTTRSFVPNGDLASLYGMSAPVKPLSAAELPVDSPRGGLLTTGALLTLHNRPTRTSPTIRGLFVRQRLLCGTVPPPPPNIPVIAEAAEASAATIREKLEQHRSNPACAACHRSMDPIGLGMEDFDQYGRHRTRYEDGVSIDPKGDLDGAMFTGTRELSLRLAEDPRVMECLVKQFYRYGSARLEVSTEQQPLQEINEAFAAGGYQLSALLLALVGSDGFRYTVEAAQ